MMLTENSVHIEAAPSHVWAVFADVGRWPELATREPHSIDRRSLQVCLTSERTRLLEPTPSLAEMFSSCCVGLSPDGAAVPASLLTELDAALSGWEQA
jgi:hypothetical protein